jgi:hypothetical protein
VVRSDSFVFEERTTTTGLDTWYTVPADRTAIIKDLRLWTTAAPGTVIFVVGARGTETAQLGALVVNAQGFAVLDPPPWAVLREGDQLKSFVGSAILLRMWVSGALLAGDPS